MENFLPKNLVKTALALCFTAVLASQAAELTRLPDFTLPDLDGKDWKSSELSGKACVIDFWATWCNTCKESVPKLVELNNKYKAQGLTVIGISVDKGSSEKIRKAAKKLGIDYLVLLDKENTLSKTFGFTGIPSLYVFDRNGALNKAMPGYDPDQESQLSQAAEKALASHAAIMPEKAPEAQVAMSEERPEVTKVSSSKAKGASTKKSVKGKKVNP